MSSEPLHRAPPLSEIFCIAADILAGVLSGHTPDAALARVDANARPAVMESVLPTLRDFGRGDFLLGRLMQTPLKETGTPLIRALLLLALHRLEEDPASAHTTVDQAVSAAAGIHLGRFKSLVNGVLRNFLRRRDELSALADDDTVARWRHPAWWVQRVRDEHPGQWQAILGAGNRHPPMSLRVNPSRSTSAELVQGLAAEGIAAQVLPSGAVYLPEPVPVARLPGFAEGVCSVQDDGAQRAAIVLGATRGMRVLDACAAPGGKTSHILEQADVDLLALDAEVKRVRRIEENLHRLGLQAKVRVADARAVATWWNGKPFDRILADVPCTASGVVRRHPDVKWLRRAADIDSFAQTQAQILDALWQTLAPDGKMLYATCSVFARENSLQVRDFLARHPDATLAGEELSLLPDDTHDGFFYALLHKH